MRSILFLRFLFEYFSFVELKALRAVKARKTIFNLRQSLRASIKTVLMY